MSNDVNEASTKKYEALPKVDNKKWKEKKINATELVVFKVNISTVRLIERTKIKKAKRDDYARPVRSISKTFETSNWVIFLDMLSLYVPDIFQFVFEITYRDFPNIETLSQFRSIR